MFYAIRLEFGLCGEREREGKKTERPRDRRNNVCRNNVMYNYRRRSRLFLKKKYGSYY